MIKTSSTSRTLEPGKTEAPWQTTLVVPTLERHLHPNSYRILAHSYERLGRFKDSKRVWEAYLQVHPEDETAKKNLQRVIGKIGG